MGSQRLSRRELIARLPKENESYLRVPQMLADETSAMFESRIASTPEQAFYAAVLAQAIIDLRSAAFHVELAQQAKLTRDWICERHTAAVPFSTCCEALNLDTAAVRERMMLIVPEANVDRRFATKGLGHASRRTATLREQ